jgi:hypothetical protein
MRIANLTALIVFVTDQALKIIVPNEARST